MDQSINQPEESRRLKDRYNRAKKNLRENKTMQQTRDHLVANKSAYIVGAIGVVAYLSKSRPQQINVTVTPSIAPVFNNTPVFNNINTVANNIGRPPYLVYIQELDKFVRSQGEAARAIGATDRAVSNYFTHGEDAINGFHLLRYKELV